MKLMTVVFGGVTYRLPETDDVRRFVSAVSAVSVRNLAQLEGVPSGLCGRRDEHEPHDVLEGSLAPFWCHAVQSKREPGYSERLRAERAR